MAGLDLGALLNDVADADVGVERLRTALADISSGTIATAIGEVRFPQYGVWAADAVGARIRPALEREARRLLPMPHQALAPVLALSRYGPIDAAFDPVLASTLGSRYAEAVHVPLAAAIEALPVARRQALLLGRLPWHLLETCPTATIADAAVAAAKASISDHFNAADPIGGLVALGSRMPLTDRLRAALPTATPAGRRVLTGALAMLAGPAEAEALQELARDDDPMVREQARAGSARLAVPRADSAGLHQAVTAAYARVRTGRGWEAAVEPLIAESGPIETLAERLADAFVHERWPHSPRPYGYRVILNLLLRRLPTRDGAALCVRTLRRVAPQYHPADDLPDPVREIEYAQAVADELATDLGRDDHPLWFDWLVRAFPTRPAVVRALQPGQGSRDPDVARVCADGLRRAGRRRGPVWPFEHDAPDDPIARLAHFATVLTDRAGYGTFFWAWGPFTGAPVDAVNALVATQDGFQRVSDLTAVGTDGARQRLRDAARSELFGDALHAPANAAIDGFLETCSELRATLHTTDQRLTEATYETGVAVITEQGCGLLWYVNDQ